MSQNIEGSRQGGASQHWTAHEGFDDGTKSSFNFRALYEYYIPVSELELQKPCPKLKRAHYGGLSKQTRRY